MPSLFDPRTLCFVNGMRIHAGAEVWMLEAAEGLRQRGYRVEFVAHPGSPLSALALAAGFEVLDISIRGDIAPWSIAALWRYFRRRRPGAVICNRLKDLKVAGLAARIAGVPIVLHSRESDSPFRTNRPLYRWYLNSVATGLLVNSQATLATTLESAPWLDPDRVHLLLKGVDLDRFTPGPRHDSVPTVGFAGRLSRRKGVPTLMDAWEILRQAPGASPTARLRIAGEGELLGDLEAWRNDLKKPEEVELLGVVDDMATFFRGIDVLALPSRYEGYGLVAAEALACERPVVACNVSSLPEIVEHGRTGLLVPVGDSTALAAALGDLLNDTDRAQAWGHAGRMAMIADHDRAQALDRLETLITPEPSRAAKGSA